MRAISLYRLSERAVTLSWEQRIDLAIHAEVMYMDKMLSQQPFPGWIENVPAYQSLTVYFDPHAIRRSKIMDESYVHPVPGTIPELPEDYPAGGSVAGVPAWWNRDPAITAVETVEQHLSHIIQEQVKPEQKPARLVRVPVCYDISVAPDLEAAAEKLHLSCEEIVALHTGSRYHVFMLGFMPGFPYMGILPAELEIPRKEVPVLQVPAGTVAIAGRQTGIYPYCSPGGWHGIGRTPIGLFSEGKPYFEPGDEVEFYAISPEAFAHWKT